VAAVNAAAKPGSVVVGVDGSPASDAALEWAADYASARHAPLSILHGAGELWDHLEIGIVPSREDAREALTQTSARITQHALEIAQRRAPGLDVEIQQPFEDPREALLDVEDASMIVLGTRGRGRLKRLLLGSVSQAVISHSSLPVTVVRPAEGRDEAGQGPVVVGVDIDGSADSALEIGFEIASMAGRPLKALHAWEADDTFVDQLGNELRAEVKSRHERGFAEAMSGYTEKYPDVSVTTQLIDGRASRALVDASASAAHIVLGARPTRRVPRYFGSVGRAVVERASCPVTVVRPA
jgi:nucleotide-binding universal stress UspA family protein